MGLCGVSNNPNDPMNKLFGPSEPEERDNLPKDTSKENRGSSQVIETSKPASKPGLVSRLLSWFRKGT